MEDDDYDQYLTTIQNEDDNDNDNRRNSMNFGGNE